MSDKKIAVVSIEFYVDDQKDFDTKTGRLFEAAEDIMECPDCGPISPCTDACEESCPHVCNMLGMSGRLMTQEEFDREFLSDE